MVFPKKEGEECKGNKCIRAVKGRRQKCNWERIHFIGFSYEEKGEEWKGNKWIRTVKGRRQKRNVTRILFIGLL